jgi:hypothetical protein
MCRNIKRLHNLAPAATEEEVRASALQYVRKISGMPKPSQANQAAIDSAVQAITALSMTLLEVLVTKAPPKSRELQAAQAKARGQARDARMRARLAQELADAAGSTP